MPAAAAAAAPRSNFIAASRRCWRGRAWFAAPAQTQREFAQAAGLRLARQSGEQRLAALPALVADAFYRVRFGRQPLDNLQVEAVEQALVEMAAALHAGTRNPRPP